MGSGGADKCPHASQVKPDRGCFRPLAIFNGKRHSRITLREQRVQGKARLYPGLNDEAVTLNSKSRSKSGFGMQQIQNRRRDGQI